jgi:hypothetical protein
MSAPMYALQNIEHLVLLGLKVISLVLFFFEGFTPVSL